MIEPAETPRPVCHASLFHTTKPERREPVQVRLWALPAAGLDDRNRPPPRPRAHCLLGDDRCSDAADAARRSPGGPRQPRPFPPGVVLGKLSAGPRGLLDRAGEEGGDKLDRRPSGEEPGGCPVGRELKTTCAPNECGTPPSGFKIVGPKGARRLEPDWEARSVRRPPPARRSLPTTVPSRPSAGPQRDALRPPVVGRNLWPGGQSLLAHRPDRGAGLDQRRRSAAACLVPGQAAVARSRPALNLQRFKSCCAASTPRRPGTPPPH
jgi:hypothetical protein